MAAHDDVLAELGFTSDDEKKASYQEAFEKAGTSENGAHVVHGVWTKGDISLHLERNTAPEDTGDDMTAVVTHPPVFVISKGGKRVVTVMQRDPEALKAVLSDLG